MGKKVSRFKMCRRLGLNVVGHPKAIKRANSNNSREVKGLSDYGKQLLEKQRLRGYYNIKEKVLKNEFKKIKSKDGSVGEMLIQRLELRLDNIVYSLGFASSIRQARQMVVHGHIRVNNKKVSSPSFKVSVNDKVKLREKSRNNLLFKENFLRNNNSNYSYLEKNIDIFTGKLIKIPNRSEIPIKIQDHLIVEFYSKVK